MKPSNFADQVIIQVTGAVANKHRALRFTVPSSGSYTTIQGSTGPSPDLVIENPTTANIVITEMKVAEPDQPISFSTLPALKLMKAAYPSTFRVVLIAVGEVPDSLRSGLEKEKIELVRVKSVADAVSRIEEIAADLDQAEGNDTAKATARSSSSKIGSP